MSKNGVTTVVDKIAKTLEAMAFLQTHRVLVGIPEDSKRKGDDPIGNAALGYIHENGSPEANIPARPFLVPGAKSIQNEAVKMLRSAGAKALEGKPEAVYAAFHAIGLMGQNAVRKKITEGPFVPLKKRTVQRRKAKHKKRKDNNPRPLIDTGQMRQSITYVIRKEK